VKPIASGNQVLFGLRRLGAVLVGVEAVAASVQVGASGSHPPLGTQRWVAAAAARVEFQRFQLPLKVLQQLQLLLMHR